MPDDEQSLVPTESAPVATGDPYEREYMRGEGLVLHRHKQRAPWQLNALFGGLALASLAPLIAGAPGAWLGVAITLPLMFLLWMLFSVLRVTVSEGSVNVQYGLFGPTIPIDAIESAVPTTYHWTRYGGWGIRYGGNGEWLYNMPGDQGRAVRVVWRDAKGRRRTTLIGSKDHVSLAESIAKARRALPAGREQPALPADEG